MTPRSKIRLALKSITIPALAGMFLCVACLSSPANANENAGMFSAAYLMELCKSDAQGRETVKGGHNACQSYISGVVDYHKLTKSLNSAPIIDFCVPNTAPMKRLQNIVYVYLAKNTQHSDFIASPAVTLALYEYYPCPVKKKRKK